MYPDVTTEEHTLSGYEGYDEHSPSHRGGEGGESNCAYAADDDGYEDVDTHYVSVWLDCDIGF